MPDLTDDTGRQGVPTRTGDADGAAAGDPPRPTERGPAGATGSRAWGTPDEMLVSDFPTLAGMPEMAALFPDVGPGRAGSRSPRALSPEIEALLARSARRVQQTEPPETKRGVEPEPVTVTGDLLSAIDELFAQDAEPSVPTTAADGAGTSDSPPRPPPRPALRPQAPADLDSGPPTIDSGAFGRREHDPPARERTVAGPPARRQTLRPGAEGTGFPRSLDPPAARGARAPDAEDDSERTSPGDTEPPSGTVSMESLFPWSRRPSALDPAQASLPTPADTTTVPTRAASGRALASEPPSTSVAASLASPPLPASSPAALDAALAIARAVGNRQTGALRLRAAQRAGESVPAGRASGAPTSRAVAGRPSVRGPSEAPPTASTAPNRRVVLREGDIVTAASEAPDETLVQFLVQRGDVSPDLAQLRTARLPLSGRHAAAALIANGFLGQDDLWPVLRAHAEWIIARAMLEGLSVCELERQLPDRLRAEPNVFGGATGAEIYIEAVRRVVSPEDARARLGPGAILTAGGRATLLAESALDAAHVDLVRRAEGTTVAEVLAVAGDELAPILYALAALGAIAVEQVGSRQPPPPRSAVDPLDEDAVRNRVAARIALVHEGDYFSLLGLTPAATGYDVRRAYVDLRRAFEPSRLLGPATADLADDVTLIVEVLDEAYDILRDAGRRKRYRRALGR